MSKTPITELDFAAIKQQLKTYLSNQTQFKDYNFEGSNMSVLLDVLAYNTFQNNFYTNMAINEMFLDTAQTKNSIISHAKELNYLPRSMTSAKATVRVTIVDNTATSLTLVIPRYTRFKTTYLGDNYNFVTNQSYLAYRVEPGVYVADNVEIYEGEILYGFEKDGFIFSEDDNTNILRCVLTNSNVDIGTIRVYADDDTEEYTYRRDIFGVEPDDLVFYLEPYFDDKYAVVFGGNVYGKQPSQDIDIKIEYRVCNGSLANGANRFSTKFMSNVNVETISPASGGMEREDLENIRYFAPRSIQIQERAITSRDYETLLKQRFTEIESVSVYGGDELDPPQHGRVAISINTPNNQSVSSAFKNSIVRYIQDKTPIGIEPIFVETEYMFALIDVAVNFDTKATSTSGSEIEQNIRDAIKQYSKENLNDFGAELYASRISAKINDIDPSVISNTIKINPYIPYFPPKNYSDNPKFNFNTKLIRPYPFRIQDGFTNYKPAIRSSVFQYNGICCYLQDDGLGNIMLVYDGAVDSVINPNAGVVDYDLGLVSLGNFIAEDYAVDGIKIIASYESSNIYAPKNRVFDLLDTDVSITIVEE